VISVVLVSVGALGLMAAGTVYGVSTNALTKTYDAPLRDVPVSADSATLLRGAHLVTAVGKCVDCHSADFGGQLIIDDPALGRVAASNLTTGRGGVLANYTDAELARAIRHGIKRDGRGAIIMPSDDWITLADDDVGAIISYIRSLPAVDRELAPTQLRAVGRTLLAAGQLPIIPAERIDHSVQARATMQIDSSVAYGKYMADVGGCTGCHGPGLSGGKVPGTPPDFKPASNLTPEGIGRLTDAQLESVLRTGRRPDGSELDAFMPWRYTALLTPVEMRALIKYLRTVDAKPFGGR
jgi:mono/diheme cytochrome c family protein